MLNTHGHWTCLVLCNPEIMAFFVDFQITMLSVSYHLTVTAHQDMHTLLQKSIRILPIPP